MEEMKAANFIPAPCSALRYLTATGTKEEKVKLREERDGWERRDREGKSGARGLGRGQGQND